MSQKRLQYNKRPDAAKKEDGLSEGQARLQEYIDAAAEVNKTMVDQGRAMALSLVKILPEIIQGAGIDADPYSIEYGIDGYLDGILAGHLQPSYDYFAGTMPLFDFQIDGDSHLYTVGMSLSGHEEGESEDSSKLKFTSYVGRRWLTYETVYDTEKGKWVPTDDSYEDFPIGFRKELENETALGGIALWYYLSPGTEDEDQRELAEGCVRKAKSKMGLVKLIEDYPTGLGLDDQTDEPVLNPLDLADDGFAIGYDHGNFILYQYMHEDMVDYLSCGEKDVYFHQVDSTSSYTVVKRFLGMVERLVSSEDCCHDSPVGVIPFSFRTIYCLNSPSSEQSITRKVYNGELTEKEQSAMMSFISVCSRYVGDEDTDDLDGMEADEAETDDLMTDAAPSEKKNIILFPETGHKRLSSKRH